jgi:hypothetical protein
MFSTDELSTIFHLPDINYNKSPIINWLDYKKLPLPSNIKTPSIPTILDEKDSTGIVKSVHRKL